MPTLQATLYLGEKLLGRSDFSWADFGVIGEADGKVKYIGEAARLGDGENPLWKEKRRQEATRMPVTG